MKINSVFLDSFNMRPVGKRLSSRPGLTFVRRAVHVNGHLIFDYYRHEASGMEVIRSTYKPFGDLPQEIRWHTSSLNWMNALIAGSLSSALYLAGYRPVRKPRKG